MNNNKELKTYAILSGPYISGDSKQTKEKMKEAFEWLKTQFDYLDGKITLWDNTKEGGFHYSFLIDYPAKLAKVDETYLADDEDTEKIDLWEQKEEWEQQAYLIEKLYNIRFSKWL